MIAKKKQIYANYRHRPLDLVEKESISVVKPKLEPLPKPLPVLDMLMSLKLLSILPEPIDCKDINPPLSPLFFSICKIVDNDYKNKSHKLNCMHRSKKILNKYLAFVNLTGFAFHHVLGFIYLALQYQLVQLLFMTLHLTVLLNLCNSHIFLVSERDDFIKSKNQLKSCPAYALFIQGHRIFRYLATFKEPTFSPKFIGPKIIEKFKQWTSTECGGSEIQN